MKYSEDDVKRLIEKATHAYLIARPMMSQDEAVECSIQYAFKVRAKLAELSKPRRRRNDDSDDEGSGSRS